MGDRERWGYRDPRGGPWAAVVLAAGRARRFGALKQVLPVGGSPMLLHPVRAALAAGASWVRVVTGAGWEAVESVVDPLRQEGLPVETRFNPRYGAGMGGSLRVGLAGLEFHGSPAVVLLADQPLVVPELVVTLVEKARSSPAGAAAVRYPEGTLGVPAALGRKLWPRLESLTEDQGARALLRSLPGVAVVEASPGMLVDVDTPEGYRALGRAGTAAAP